MKNTPSIKHNLHYATLHGFRMWGLFYVRALVYGVSVLLSLFLLVSCKHIPRYEGTPIELTAYPYDSKDTFPTMLVSYTPAYAYRPIVSTETGLNFFSFVKLGEKVSLGDVRAVREHGSLWSDAAMRYDLDGMQSNGFTGILLRVRPEDMLDPIRLSRIKTFFNIAGSFRPAMHVGLLVYSDVQIELGSGNFAQFLLQADMGKLPAALYIPPYEEDKRMLVMFDSASILLNQQSFHEENAFDFRILKNHRDMIDNEDFRWIEAGNCGVETRIDLDRQNGWTTPRGDGSFLAHALHEAFQDKVKIICIHSWNGFKDGSFIVDNNFDNRLMLNTIYREFEALETLRTAPVPPKEQDVKHKYDD